MCVDKPSLIRAALRLILLGCLLGISSFAFAQQQNGTLWIVEGSSREAAERESQLRDVLATSRGSVHVVGQAGIQERIEAHGLDIPACLDGTATCEAPFAAVLQALDLHRMVKIKLERNGQVTATAYDASGAPVRSLNIEARNARQAVMRAVSEITGATGQLLVDSQPHGATVFIDGSEVGKTPLNRSLSVGSYSVDVMFPGYAPVHETIDVPPDGSARRSFALERLQATLTVRSGTPGATIRVDDEEARLPINEALLIDPGPHRITVEAQGYESVTERFDFEPGQSREFSATLALSMRELTRRRIQAVYDRPLMIQAGLRYHRYGSDWSGARGIGGNDERIDCGMRPVLHTCQSSPINAIGFDIEAIYAWKHLEVEALGISFYHLGQTSDAIDFKLENNPTVLSHITGGRTLIRIGHVGGRYLVNEFFEPYARVGFSFAADRMRARDLYTNSGTYRFKRSAVLLELRAGTRLRLNQLLYGYAEAGVAFHLRSGSKAGVEVAAGVGVNLPNPFAKKSEDASRRRLRNAPEELPEEL